jgi:hypothetical protein
LFSSVPVEPNGRHPPSDGIADVNGDVDGALVPAAFGAAVLRRADDFFAVLRAAVFRLAADLRAPLRAPALRFVLPLRAPALLAVFRFPVFLRFAFAMIVLPIVCA